MKYNLSQLELYRLLEDRDPFAIKNFIVTHSNKMPKNISLNHPYIYDGFILGICIKGQSKMKINLKEYELEPNTLMSITPHSIIEFGEKSEDLLFSLLFFSVDFLLESIVHFDYNLISLMGQNPCIAISEESMKNVLEFHSFIVKQYNRVDHKYREKIAQALLSALLLEISSIYKTTNFLKDEASSHQEELVHHFFQLLIQNYKTQKNISFYADKLCVTPKYISTIVKKVTGKTMISWIKEIVILDAKFRLKSTSSPIVEISEELNFPSASLFGRFFKQYTGITPLNYRNDS